MNVVQLNTANLDGDKILIKKGSGSGGVKINNQEKSIDITENGVFEVLPDSDFTGLAKVTANVEIAMPRPKYTGHADAEGLRAIGWTDEDIAYYQENGVNWNEEDDQYHLVSDDNKALYGVLTANNISTYKDRIVYLPKIDTSSVTSMDYMFQNCRAMVAIPQLDTSSATGMYLLFANCYSLTSIPQLDTSGVKYMDMMFENCYSLTSIPQLDTSKVTYMDSMFYNCHALTSIPQLDTSSATSTSNMFSGCYFLRSIPQLDTSKVTNMQYMFRYCYSLTSIPQLDTSKVTKVSSMFSDCYSLTYLELKNAKLEYDISTASLLTKGSLLYLINNEAATSKISIKLASYAYDRWANDPDVLAALANHPNMSLAK